MRQTNVGISGIAIFVQGDFLLYVSTIMDCRFLLACEFHLFPSVVASRGLDAFIG